MFCHKGGQISILSQGKEIFLVQSIYITGRILGDNFVGNNQRSTFVKCSKPVHAETKVILAKSELKDKKNEAHHPGKQVTDPKRDSNALAK